MARKRKRKARKAPKVRNWIAVHAHLRGGAGSHGDARKEQARKACRGKQHQERD